ncbi:MAG: Methicillin resistance protein [Microgenomates group bacterium GW2011_GWA2_39_19]|nr:MAG: Methicillin resistance protein [Microgenomates group bacterium GW2011_GWA2_39_19]
MIDLRQTKEYANYMEKIGWQVEKIQNPNVKIQIFIRKIPLLGKVVKIQRPQFISKETIDEILISQKPIALYVEPPLLPLFSPLSQFSHSSSCFLPPKTIHIDLKKTEKELLAGMKIKTRYNIKIAKKRGVVVIKSMDIDKFCNLWKSAARKRGMWLPLGKEITSLFESFGLNAHILLAYHDDQPLGGILLICTKDICYYMYACSTPEGKKLFAPTLLAWEAIKLAKKKGCKIFDFEGVYDERYSQTKSWKGFTKFKEGFGGEIATYPETLVKYSNPIVKLLL